MEDYGFEYSDDDYAEEDVDIENQYYNSKGKFMTEMPWPTRQRPSFRLVVLTCADIKAIQLSVQAWSRVMSLKKRYQGLNKSLLWKMAKENGKLILPVNNCSQIYI